ncbi:PorT family protein [Hymenobacter sp. BT175]|uniref:outer membrane beta-barrel protein n=1 Tax=Hymenobacter translucens TaxID=2886507 RepID=UPI001D0E2F15|nr:outer membrane beta-barrel protein [Hymenobacter translucens]MCC2545963.1 PorT family protein [Hymenobacter translucens]
MLRYLLKLTAVGVLAIGTHTSFAQATGGTRVGLKAGVSLASFNNAVNAELGTRTDFVVGPMLRLKPSAQGFGVQLEALISGQGARLETSTGTQVEKVYYLNAPLLLRQYVARKFYVNVGPQLGVFLGSKGREYKPLEGSVVGGVGVELPNGLTADMRLQFGLTEIIGDPAERSLRRQLSIPAQHNRVLQFTFGYLFGGK